MSDGEPAPDRNSTFAVRAPALIRDTPTREYSTHTQF